jgi:hypothetical protein
MAKWRSVLYATTIALLSFPVYADGPRLVHTSPSGISAWLQQQSVPSDEHIEVTLGNGTILKGLLRRYSSEEMVVYIEPSRGKKTLPSGETRINYTGISKFSLRVGAPNRAFLGGFVGFLVGALPGMGITMNDYGSKTTEKVVGPVITLVGGIGGAWVGSRLGARKRITIEVTP